MRQTLQQKAEELGARPYFYYIGTVTVCLLKKDDEIARGLSFMFTS
jgi:hypothetical protein